MKLRRTDEGLIATVDGERWVALAAADGLSAEEATEMVAFLRGGERTRTAAEEAVASSDTRAADPATAGLPFAPRSMRAFMLWESHVIASSRMLVKHFFPKPAWQVVRAFEKTGRTFPKLRPNQRFWDAPTFYVANHTMVLADGQEMWWPSHTKALDFELELACVLRAPLVDATPGEARAAVGGWFVLNDWSARDVQADDARHNVFGPVIKAKTFANSIGSDVVIAEAFGDWKGATGRVYVDEELWCEGATAGPAHDIGEMLAYASQGERLDAGDVISTGTMPGCCGLELERWIKPGQTVRLEIDGIGSVSNRISADAVPATAAGMS